MLVVIPLEIKKREFIQKTFLSYQILKKTEFDILIGGQRFFSKKIKSFKNVIFFDKSTYYKRIEDLINPTENKLCMLDEEGPISLLPKQALKFKYNKKLKGKIDHFFFWGKNDIKILSYKIDNKNKSVAGHPKFDLLKKPYVNYFDEEVKFIKKKYKNYIFYASSIDPNTKYYAGVEENYLKENYPKSSQSFIKKELKKIIEYKKNTTKNQDRAITVLHKLAIDNPEINIVFRKHPREDLEDVKKKFKNFPNNFILNDDFSITPWIIGCDVYMHSGCSSSIEASILKKKIITIIPYGKDIRNKFFRLYGIICNEEKKCISELNKIGEYKILKEYKPMKNYIFNSNKKFFFYNEFIKYLKKNNLKDRESKIFFHKEVKNKMLIISYFFKNFIYKFLSITKSMILKTFLISLVPEKYLYSKKELDKKFDNLSQKEIENVLKKFKKIDKGKFNYKIKKMSDSIFLLSKVIKN